MLRRFVSSATREAECLQGCADRARYGGGGRLRTSNAMVAQPCAAECLKNNGEARLPHPRFTQRIIVIALRIYCYLAVEKSTLRATRTITCIIKALHIFGGAYRVRCGNRVLLNFPLADALGAVGNAQLAAFGPAALRLGILKRWRRSHRHLRLMPSFCASSVSLIVSWCSITKR